MSNKKRIKGRIYKMDLTQCLRMKNNVDYIAYRNFCKENKMRFCSADSLTAFYRNRI